LRPGHKWRAAPAGPARPPPYHRIARPNGRGHCDGTAGLGADHVAQAGRSDPGAAGEDSPRAAAPLLRSAVPEGAVVMVVRHLPKVHTLLEVLAEPGMRPVRELLTEGGRCPSRRTWERRLRALPDSLPARLGCLGRWLVEVLDPWREGGRAGAIDSTVLRALGGVWHRKDREAGVVPHT